ncbi:MAG: 50S ribosomal protein L5 [Patescibacteria group bacterium]
MKTTKEKQNKAFEILKERFGYVNRMEAPRLVKIVVSVGTGSTKDKEKLKIIPDRLAKITGQKPAPRASKKSIATWKLREGEVVGQVVTLRGARMLSFFDKLINVTLPRTRDFKGIARTAVDEMGNLTIGVKEHTVFPEASDEELKNVFGMAITVVTTAENKEEATALFEHLGVPFKK